MSIYGDLTDDLLNENINEKLELSDNDEKSNDEDKDNENPVKVEPKKRTVRNPQFRLNADCLRGDRGIHTVERYFKNIKYYGKGHEKTDLDNIMKNLSHWAHRLYPKFQFDDCLHAVEKLGKKRVVQTHMIKYRQGMIEDNLNKEIIDENNEDNFSQNDVDGDNQEILALPFDELDALLDNQIINETNRLKSRTPHHQSDTTFDSLKDINDTSITSNFQYTPHFHKNNHNQISSTPHDNHNETIRNTQENNTFIDKNNENTEMPSGSQTARLTSEQIARIAENRRLAQEKLRLKRESLASASNTNIIL